ncbi:MAG TPA: hypothetical protein VFL95_01075 [Gemmatimonadales bacterium]|nr:hypothetical protein [Gemmatimonadales bacterium]
MSEPPEMPELPDLPPGSDPAALMAFMQRLMNEMMQGGDINELLSQAPPGFAELFAEAQRQMESGNLDGLGLFGGDPDAGDENDESEQ